MGDKHGTASPLGQVMREHGPSRGTETSADVLIGPPGRMVSNAGVHSSGTRLTLAVAGRRPRWTPRPAMAPYPFPSTSSVGEISITYKPPGTHIVCEHTGAPVLEGGAYFPRSGEACLR